MYHTYVDPAAWQLFESARTQGVVRVCRSNVDHVLVPVHYENNTNCQYQVVYCLLYTQENVSRYQVPYLVPMWPAWV